MASSTKFTGNWDASRGFAAAKARLIRDLEQAMRETMEIAVDAGRNRIESSGTSKQWSREWRGRTRSGPGRVETGEMRDQFDMAVSSSGQVVKGRFGWLEGTPYYFLFQEYGFKHWITNELIQGMFALDAADQIAQGVFVGKLERAVKEFIDAVSR
jgi:hypothetical protein